MAAARLEAETVSLHSKSQPGSLRSHFSDRSSGSNHWRDAAVKLTQATFTTDFRTGTFSSQQFPHVLSSLQELGNPSPPYV